jgi:hypothetical protein
MSAPVSFARVEAIGDTHGSSDFSLGVGRLRQDLLDERSPDLDDDRRRITAGRERVLGQQLSPQLVELRGMFSAPFRQSRNPAECLKGFPQRRFETG